MDLIERTRTWIDADPDPATRRELEALVAAGDTAELGERMAGSLEFGTAGLRGRVEAGSNRMNRAVVIRTTAGLASFLAERTGPVVVGRDARLSSWEFMQDVVGVLVAAGIPVVFFPDPVPTPVVAYAALRDGARAAVVITASHNPPADNGYKVYDDNGAQIIPPVDGHIAAAIDDIGPAIDVIRAEDPLDADLATPVDPDVFDAYLDDLTAVRPTPAGEVEASIVYTPMHGVGGRYVLEALARFGHEEVSPVVEQFPPDGHFPTVSFPNPEEPGALDMATDHAERIGADLIIANDPDTDRLAVSVVRPDGTWRPLTGNQIGVLLGEHILAATTVDDPVVVNSIVSSPMLGSVAEAHGARFEQTLTGFKWIWNAALDLQARGAGTFVFGYEEALGYSVSPQVRDKDGISAAVFFADLATAGGVLGALESLYRRHGLWVSSQRSVVRPGTEGAREIASAMARIGGSPPSTVGGVAVTDVIDYSTGADRRPRHLAATSLLALHLGETGRVLIRPSGTEPKLKVYTDLRQSLAMDVDVWEAERHLLSVADDLAADVVGQLGW